MLVWKKDREDDVLVVNGRAFGDRDVEVLRINGSTGEVKASKAMSAPNHNVARLAIGAEGAVAANAIEVAVSVRDALGNAVSGVRQACVRSLAVSDAQGTLAAAGTPVGTLKKASNPATAEKQAWFETTAAGLFSFRVTDTVAEECLVEVEIDGCAPRRIKLTFA